MGDTWTDRLSDYVDGDVTPDECRAIDAHLAACSDCARTVRELRQVIARAATLASRPPAGDLWPGIQRQLSVPAGTPTWARRSLARRVSLTMPQVVAAGLALMVLSGGAVWIVQHGGRATSLPPAVAASTSANAAPDAADHQLPVGLADPPYDAAIADLQEALARGRSRLDPQTVTVLEKNLSAIDRAIDESRRALERDPANVFLNTHLADARQRKLALLRQAVAITTTKGL